MRLQRDPSPQKDQYAEIYRDQSKYAENLKRREREKSEKNRKAREEADYKQKLVSLQTKLDITTPPAPKRFISGYFPRGGLSIVVAAPGTGKTWFILRIACDLSIGGPIFDGFAEEARPLKSLIFAGEAGSELLLHRVYDTHWDFNMDNITIIDMINAENDGVSLMFDTEAGRRNIEIFISENKPDIVFFDT
ncbi:MAG: AAA family ATPase, partial [Synergistaceae bacterium]|nr:AAA family ATPase [Synergistaceae bacterium]